MDLFGISSGPLGGINMQKANMKHFPTPLTVIIFSATISLLLVGCKNNLPTQSSARLDTSITGSWSWIKSTGGYAGSTITPASVGYTIKISFKPNSVFELYHNDTLLASTDYTLRQYNSSNIIHYADSIRFRQQYVQLAAYDTLTLTDNVADGYSSAYSRLR